MNGTIIIVAYAVNPYKGSEDGTGWNWIKQASASNNIIAITRKNNQADIERYQSKNEPIGAEFRYYDLPKWARFWKRGPKGAMPYYLLWQAFLPIFIQQNIKDYHIIHHLNFHNDWTPTFGWTLGKPVVWGPIGHHSKIPKQFILPFYGKKAYVKDRMTSLVKNYFWKIDPLLKISRTKAKAILKINSAAVTAADKENRHSFLCPAIACKKMEVTEIKSEKFLALTVGRFVPLKGMDVSIRSFAKFVKSLPENKRKQACLKIVGKGPCKSQLAELIRAENMQDNIEIIEWMAREDLLKLFQRCSLFLFPSHEGAGMVVMEAMAAGLPLLCFDNDGPGELVNEECAIKIPYGEYEETIEKFSSGLKELFSNRGMLKQMSTAAIEYQASHHSWEERGELLAKVYNRILQNERKNQPTLFPLPE